eukprot:snap_masked-scaffold_53-processed-gene-0.25-mRNA-1 protein AED:1.00 eAED:1.00 QI:0/-1/0/0/-1/1/1/0/64
MIQRFSGFVSQQKRNSVEVYCEMIVYEEDKSIIARVDHASEVEHVGEEACVVLAPADSDQPESH